MLFSSRNRQPRASRRSPTPSNGPNAPSRHENFGVSSRSPSPGSSGTKPLYLCSPFADAALVKGNFKTIVMLPKYTDIMEWVAVNSAFFFGSFLLL
jgi:MOB kinase activator 1